MRTLFQIASLRADSCVALTASLTIFAGIVLSLKQPIRLHGYPLSDLLGFLDMALGAIESLAQQNMVVSRCRQSIERIVQTCRTLVNQGSQDLRVDPNPNLSIIAPNLGMLNPPEFNHSENRDSRPSLPMQSWSEPQIEFDMEWASSLAVDIQDCWGGL